MDINKLLREMTLEEKIGQLNQYTVDYFLDTEALIVTGPNHKKDGKTIKYAGSLLNCFNTKQMIEIQRNYMKDHNIPLLFMLDVVHGYKTIYPIPLAMGATFNPELLKRCCKMAAKEASTCGVHVTFSPMVDMVRDARWGRVMETTGEDPYLNEIMAKSQVEGYQQDFKNKYSIAGCVKHFACYGACESGKDYNMADMSEHTLFEYYMSGYKGAIDADVAMVMSSFNTLNGIPVSANKWLLTDVLKEKLNFKGIVISDFDAINDMIKHQHLPNSKECAYKAFDAGIDIDMMSIAYFDHLKDLIKENKVSIEKIDEAVYKILELKDKLGLFENPYLNASISNEKKVCLCKSHLNLATKAAEESFVLLKNEDNVLPLNENSKISLIGPFADKVHIGSWFCLGEEKDGVSIYQGLKENFVNLDMPSDENVINSAKEADVVLMSLGEKYIETGEGNSKANIKISDDQIQLIKNVYEVNKNLVLLLYTGRPIVLSDVEKYFKSIVVMWQPGTMGGKAISNLLSGKTNFSGKLTMSFPRHIAQVPIYYNYLNTGRPKQMMGQGFVSGYLDVENSPLYPFGYGLSYSNFKIHSLKISKNSIKEDQYVTVSVKVKNQSNVDGYNTIQLYINDLFSDIVRPVLELKGFKKVFIKANEEKTIRFKVDKNTLGYYRNGNFVTEKGDFNIYVSDSSLVTDFVRLTYK